MREWFGNFASKMVLYGRIFVLLFAIGVVCALAVGVVFAVPAFFQPKQGGLVSGVSELSPATASDTVMILAAHPDDEFLSSAGYIAASVQNHAAVYVVVVTNGEASLIAETLSHHSAFLSPAVYIQEGNARPEESKQALNVLGVARDHVYFLGYPTRGLKNLLFKNWSLDSPFYSKYTRQDRPVFSSVFDPQATYTGESAVSDIERLMKQIRPTIMVTHSKYDENSDHQAVYYLVQKAVAQAHATDSTLPVSREYFFLVHYRLYSFPGVARYAYVLAPPLGLSEQRFRWYSFTLSRSEFGLKQQGMSEYQSQLVNPYLKLLLNSFVKHNELFYREK